MHSYKCTSYKQEYLPRRYTSCQIFKKLCKMLGMHCKFSCWSHSAASSKTLTSGRSDRGTDHRRSTDRAAYHTWSTADHTRSTMEDYGEGRNIFNLDFLIDSCYIFINFWDLFYDFIIFKGFSKFFIHIWFI